MLPAVHRMRLGSDFEATVRRGRRSGRRCLVVHAVIAAGPGATDASSGSSPARVGFVVSRAVGTAVVRNRVKRRLRAAMAERVAGLRPGTLVVVRAQPAAATATAAVLRQDLDAALPRALEAASVAWRRDEVRQ